MIWKKLLAPMFGFVAIAGFSNAAVLRTGTDGVNACQAGNRVELRVFLDDNNDDVNHVEFVIEHPSADFNYDSFDSPSHDGDIEVEELSDDGDESRLRVRVTWGIGDDNFEEGTVVELDFIVQRNITGTTRFQLENEELSTEDDSDANVDVNTSATEPITCGVASPSPTPTVAPTASPTPTPAPGGTIYSTTFDTGTAGWTSVSVPAAFAEPTFSNVNQALAVSANGSSNCFGFWKSPRIAVTGGHRLEIQWRVRSTSLDILTPAFRLRTTDGQFRYTQFLAIESPAGGVSPGLSDKLYTTIYDVPADANEIELAFDITSFNALDDTTARIELADVTVKRQ